MERSQWQHKRALSSRQKKNASFSCKEIQNQKQKSVGSQKNPPLLFSLSLSLFLDRSFDLGLVKRVRMLLYFAAPLQRRCKSII
jgi:hypothetical protein